MFPPRYFALRYFPLRYFGTGFNTNGGYFGHRYFAARYFAPYYFAPLEPGAVVGSGDLDATEPPDICEIIGRGPRRRPGGGRPPPGVFERPQEHRRGILDATEPPDRAHVTGQRLRPVRQGALAARERADAFFAMGARIGEGFFGVREKPDRANVQMIYETWEAADLEVLTSIDRDEH